MMNIILTKLHRFGRIRHLHTRIISQETIKPSSPTPCHLKTHNLSLIDKYIPPVYIPMIFFYKNYNNNINGDINIILKKSLSQCLTHYYPFAGRLPTTSSLDHVNCNDAGVEFLESSINSRLDDFVVNKLEQGRQLLLPHSLGCGINKTSTMNTSSIVEIQLTHFTCGGVALGVSIAHKVADGFTAVNFMRHWAAVTHGETPPVKLSFSSPVCSYISNNPDLEQQQAEILGKVVKHVTRRFVFSNSKLNELKNKIIKNANNTCSSSSTSVVGINPTRVDSLTSLLFECAVTTKSKSGSSSTTSQQYSNLVQTVNLRGGSKFPKLGAGNMIGLVSATINNAADSSSASKMITSLRKQRMELQGIRDEEEILKKWSNIILLSNVDDGPSPTYYTSSICGFPVYQVDFGWGNPVRAVIRGGNDEASFFMIMDTPSGDGIEATVNLKEEEMAIFQQDQKLLAYTQQDI